MIYKPLRRNWLRLNTKWTICWRAWSAWSETTARNQVHATQTADQTPKKRLFNDSLILLHRGEERQTRWSLTTALQRKERAREHRDERLRGRGRPAGGRGGEWKTNNSVRNHDSCSPVAFGLRRSRVKEGRMMRRKRKVSRRKGRMMETAPTETILKHDRHTCMLTVRYRVGALTFN